jgi:citrate lyase alpha subunit
MELEGLTIMAKHPWRSRKDDPYVEETEYFLNGPTRSFSIDIGTGCSSTTGWVRYTYDSMPSKLLKPVDALWQMISKFIVLYVHQLMKSIIDISRFRPLD